MKLSNLSLSESHSGYNIGTISDVQNASLMVLVTPFFAIVLLMAFTYNATSCDEYSFIVLYIALIRYFTLWYLVTKGISISGTAVDVTVIGVDELISNVPSFAINPDSTTFTFLST